MTLALFHPTFGTLGGAEILAATQARCLRNAGLDICLVTLSLNREIWSGWLEGIPIRVAKPAPLLDGVLPPATRMRRAATRVAECLADREVVLACNYPGNVLVGAAAIGATKVWSCNEPYRDTHQEAANPRLFERILRHPGGTTAAELNLARRVSNRKRLRERIPMEALRSYDIEQTRKIHHFCAISEFSRGVLRRIYGVNDVDVIYPIVRFPSPTAHRSGLDRSGLRILTHSRLEAVKNVDTVVRAFALYRARDPGARLHVVGVGAELRNLRALSQQLGLAEAVVFHGYLPDHELDAVYAECDVFALLPLDEPFGMVFPEAAARGLLLVGPDHGGPFEIVDGGRHGWACDPFSPQSLADVFATIRALPDDEVDLRRIRADESCRGRFSERAIGPQLVALLTESTRGAT